MTRIKHFLRPLLALLFVFVLFTGVALAHGGGFPQLSNAQAGPYLVSVWTQPQPVQVGEIHFTVAVSNPPALKNSRNETGPPILDANVTLKLTPLDAAGETLLLSATHKEAVNKLYYETDTELLLDGRWEVSVLVEGPDGPGSAGFTVDVLPISNSNWILYGSLGAVALLTVWGVGAFKNGVGLTFILAVAVVAVIAGVLSINWIFSWQSPFPPASAEAYPINWYALKNRVMPGTEELVIEVVASQWTWQFDYPQSGVSSDKLNIPLGQTVQLKMTSTDVIHSFSVPEFLIDQDIVPGTTTQAQITPIKPGIYKASCTALCGPNYSNMLADVNVMEPARFEAWLIRQQSATAHD